MDHVEFVASLELWSGSPVFDLPGPYEYDGPRDTMGSIRN